MDDRTRETDGPCHRRLVPGSQLLPFLVLAPVVIPGVVLAVGLFIAYTRPPLLLALYAQKGPGPPERIQLWTAHFLAAGADSYTARRRAVAMLYSDTVEQAHVLAYGDAYFMLTVVFTGVILLLPWMRRVRVEQTDQRPAQARVEGLPEPAPE
jgi:ABC-type spermidine/putrescine transport system permease subunit II